MNKNYKKNRNSYKSYFNGFSRVFITILIAITILNNFRVSEGTRNRDNISATWEALTENRNFFVDVKNKDLFVSTTYNDAYQINVADFYQRTKIRLAAFVWPGYIWDDFESCTNYESCPLDGAVPKITDWLTNISKGESELRILMKQWKFDNDWTQYIRDGGALKDSNFWYFNIYMITDSVGLAYLIPLKKSARNLDVDIQKSKVFTLSLNEPTDIKPSIFGYCMTPLSGVKKISVRSKSAFAQTWVFPETLDNFGKIDIRQVSTGTC